MNINHRQATRTRWMVLASLFVTVAFTAPAAYSQVRQTPEITRQAETLKRIAQLEILTKILPVTLDKKQLEGLLPAIEKARQKRQEIIQKDAEELAKVEKEIEEALKKAIKEERIPPQEFQTKIAKVTNALTVRRAIAVDEIVANLVTFCKSSWNEGQIKAAVGSFDPRLFDPKMGWDKLGTDDKLAYYTRTVLLDELTYDVLKQLLRSKNSGG